jgi:hypothetical protein
MRGPGLEEYETRCLCVKDPPFRARGNGVTDDSLAFQHCIDLIRTYGGGRIFVPTGVYRINTSLDCTGFLGFSGIKYRSLNIEGESINGSRILGATSGNPVFDFTASGYCSMENLRITGHSSNTPNIALLLARNTAAGSAGVHNFRRLFVEGEFTKGGIYSFASEENLYDHVRVNISGGGATWCIAITNSNFESIASLYETILAVTAPSTRNVLLEPQLKMSDEVVGGTCLHVYGQVRDLACYSAYMYSEAQSHIKIEAPNATNSPRRLIFHNLRAERGATKPDYGLFMTGASDGNFDAIEMTDGYLDAHTWGIYQDNTVTGNLANSVFSMLRFLTAPDIKLNKAKNCRFLIPIGNLTIDNYAVNLEISNFGTGTVTLPAGADMIFEKNYATRLFSTTQIKRAESIGTLANSATPSVGLCDYYKTGGTTTITSLTNGITGQVIIIIGEHTTTQLTDGGTLRLAGNCVLDVGDTITLICKDGTNWYELSRSNN